MPSNALCGQPNVRGVSAADAPVSESARASPPISVPPRAGSGLPSRSTVDSWATNILAKEGIRGSLAGNTLIPLRCHAFCIDVEAFASDAGATSSIRVPTEFGTKAAGKRAASWCVARQPVQ